jgi:hypothetical protein
MFCTPNSLCTVEHTPALSLPTYAHILYTDSLCIAYYRMSLPIPSLHIHTFSGMCKVWHLVVVNYITTGWLYPILYWDICGDIICAGFIDICDILTGGSIVCVLLMCNVLPTAVTNTSSGLTEVEFTLRSYSCCRHSSVIIMDNYSTTVPAAFGTSLWKRKSVSWLLCEKLGRKYSPVMDPNESFPCPQKLTTGSYPKPDKTSALVCFNPLQVQFKSLLPGQEGRVFFSGHLNTLRFTTLRPAKG